MIVVTRFRALALAAACIAQAGGALAQTPTAAQQATFVRMQSAPVDHDNTFDYVQASVQNRDYEGAISALERILAYNPNLTQAKFELGVLYFRLRSFEQAVLHFEDALADPAIDPALARRIAGFLPEARKQLQQSRFSGVFQVGIRSNSNTAGLPGSSIFRAFGVDSVAVGPYSNRGDGSIFALGQIGHVYDFQNQRGDVWESQFAGFAARQFRLTALDVALAELSTGPRLALAPDALPGWTIRPYFAAGGAAIQERGYSSTWGGGVSIGVPVSPMVSLEPGFEARRVSVRTVDGLPSQATLATGALWAGSLAANWNVTDNVTFAAKGYFGRNSADAGGISSRQYGLQSSVKVEFAPPFETIGMNWSATPFVRLAFVDFARADATVDPFVARRDRQFRAGLQFDMPVTPMLGVNASAQFTRNDSNIQNYRASSWSFLLGPTARF